MNALSTNGLVKRFDATVAVQEVDLAVAPGEVRGLLGPNGAGKTTLLRMLLGLIAPDRGTIELFGQPVLTVGGVGTEGVAGFVEMPCFYPYLSGRANLEVLSKFDSDDSDGAIELAIERLGLRRRADDRVSGYSTGMRQRLGIAAALMAAPRLLLLDEPTSGLDPAGAREVADLILELAADGVSVLLSSHRIGEVEAICDTFTVLSRGRVVWDGPASRLRQEAPASAFNLHTADDDSALAIGRRRPDLEIMRDSAGNLRVTASQEAMDAFIVELGRSDVAVRRLDVLESPLEAMFFLLTADPPSNAMAAAGTR